MKKFFMILMTAGAILLGSGLVSCSKSNQDLINDYKNVCQELVEATKDGDLTKIASLTEKGTKIEKELSERELTSEEEAELAKIAEEVANAAVSGASNMMDNALEGLDSGF